LKPLMVLNHSSVIALVILCQLRV
ncbi:CoF synthetase, partial [Xylella fastidiosa]